MSFEAALFDAPASAHAGSVAVPAASIESRSWRTLQTPSQIARWDALAEAAIEPNPFHESWYLLPALRAFDPAGRVPLLCLEADGRLAGLLPLSRELRYYRRSLPHWRGWTHPNAFLGTPLVAPGYETAFWRALLAWVDRRSAGALFLHLAQICPDGPLYHALGEVLAEQGRPAAVVRREERALLDSRLSPDDYLEASLAGKKRKELRRQHRRLAEEGELAVERCDDARGVSAWVSEFLALERRGWKGAAGSAMACDARTASLFSEALAGAARRGRLERLAIRLDGKPVAMLASFLCPPGAFSFKTAFDEDFARFSPGVLLQRENLVMLERPGIAWTDSCAAADHPMIEHFWRERRTVASVNLAVGGAARRALFRFLARCETGRSAEGIV